MKLKHTGNHHTLYNSISLTILIFICCFAGFFMILMPDFVNANEPYDAAWLYHSHIDGFIDSLDPHTRGNCFPFQSPQFLSSKDFHMHPLNLSGKILVSNYLQSFENSSTCLSERLISYQILSIHVTQPGGDVPLKGSVTFRYEKAFTLPFIPSYWESQNIFLAIIPTSIHYETRTFTLRNDEGTSGDYEFESL